MVNNRIKRGCKSLPLFFLAFFLLPEGLNAQNVSKHYTSSLQSGGTLYFIFPQSGFKNNSNGCSLTYDITYFTKNDSAVINFSFYDKSEHSFDSIILMSNNLRFSSETKKLFVETKKSLWHYRYTSTFSISCLAAFFNPNNRVEIILQSSQNQIPLNINTKKWETQSSRTQKILALINHNR